VIPTLVLVEVWQIVASTGAGRSVFGAIEQAVVRPRD